MFILPKLQYPTNALEPYIDATTMLIHHDRHHQTYIDKLNDALNTWPDYQDMEIEELLRGLDELPDAIKTAVRNHGGGHHNHTLFWESLSPIPLPMSLGFETLVKTYFGSIELLQQKMVDVGATLFGSGWVWLVQNEDGALEVKGLPNQDSPLAQGLTPLLGLDVWEHAYYLRYQNRRPDYLNAIFNVVDWGRVSDRAKIQ